MFLSPSLSAVSGVSTLVNTLLGSSLRLEFDLSHFQVGSEGRDETVLRSLWRLLASPFLLFWTLFRRQPDIVHLNVSLDPKGYWRDLVYLFIARLMRRGVVNQIHGGAMPQTLFPRSRFLTWIFRRALVASDAVVVLSSAEVEAYRKFDARINVYLVPNAINATDLAEVARLFNHDKPLRLVYVGRIVANKGLFESLECLRLLKARGHLFTLRIAGDGPAQEALRAAADSTGLAGEVMFLGKVFGEAKNRLWLDSDVFVFPTYNPEGLPYALLEAMAAGCVPVICPVAAIPDVMQDGVHGLFVPPKDPEALARALIFLDRQRDELTRMARAARERISEHYLIDRLVRDLMGIYRHAAHNYR